MRIRTVKKKFVVIAYDIVNDRNRTKISKLLEDYGERVNFSVFECMLTPKQLSVLQSKIERRIDSETDKVIYYTLCIDCFSKIETQPEYNKKDAESINIV